MLALAAHGRSIEDRLGGVGRTLVARQASPGAARLTLQELLLEARLLQEDIESQVPYGAPGRVPALAGARDLVRAGGYLHSYASGHTAGLPLAHAHIAAAARELAGAAHVLRGRLTPVQEETLAHLEAPAPKLTLR